MDLFDDLYINYWNFIKVNKIYNAKKYYKLSRYNPDGTNLNWIYHNNQNYIWLLATYHNGAENISHVDYVGIYLKKSLKINKKTIGTIVNYSNDAINHISNGIVIYGAGYAGKQIYQELRKNNEDVSFFVDDDLNKSGFTAPINIVKDKMILAGYTGWDSGQLEDEILSNFWFPVDINLNDISKISIKYRFKYALRKLGIGLHNFSLHSGNS